MGNYKEEYRHSIENPVSFWREKGNGIEWFKEPENILTYDEDKIAHWFADGEMNSSYLAVDYHVKNGRKDQLALIYDSPVTNTIKKYSYGELLEEVALTAGMLKEYGVEKGDTVIIYMPMIPETVIAMLACARIGAIHSVVFGGFAAPELAVRIDDATPKLILSASCGIEISRIIDYKKLLDDAINIASFKPSHSIIFQRPELIASLNEKDVDWKEALKKATAADPVAVRGDDLLYILYTSGSTGAPKGVTRESGGHAVALKYSMDLIYDIKPGDVYWAASDVGWVVGHSYIVYAPLFAGATTILYEGKPIMTPDAGAFWRVIEEHKVKSLFTAPTAFRAIKKEDPDGKLIKDYDISSLETIFSAGERLDPPTYRWLEKNFDVPILDHWWQTETGWAIAANMHGLERMPVKAGSATLPVPGFNVKIIDGKGEEVAANEQGNVVIKLPLPPSCLTSIWKNRARFHASYLDAFPQFYLTGDGGYIDDDGYLFIMGRTDDVINVAGHRLSTGGIEEVIGKHEMVAECAVVGREDALKGQVPFGFVVLKNNATIPYETLMEDLVKAVRSSVGAIACFKEAITVKKLPKTRSGKILRKTLREIIDQKEFEVPSTIDDPESLSEVESALKQWNADK
ncbi:MAG: acetate--CoA ligase [Nitrospinota bacterium]